MFWIYLLALVGAQSVQLGRAQYFGAPTRRCINPNQRAGTCVSIYDCQTLLSVLQRGTLQSLDAEFLRASECVGGYGNGPHVCCTGDTGYTRASYDNMNGRDTTVLFPSNNPWQPRQLGGGGKQPREVNAVGISSSAGGGALLPRPPTCGGVTISNKIYGGSDTDLYEFPWMVLLEYNRRAGGVSSSCAGSLINQRYVVTAAHCVKGAIERQIGSLAAVRLGEYDSSTPTDCDQFSCAPSTQRVGIEEIITHEQYRDSQVNKQHDIALLRLDRDIRFSDSVRPICLPSAVSAPQQLATGTKLTVAGWGRTLNSPRSAVKQKLQVPIVDQAQCQQQYRKRKVKIEETQLCAGGEYARDSCDGDSGGPLMQFRNDAWVLEGIVSFGYKCGLRDWPGVYTRVANYDDWIRSKIRN